MKRRVTEVALTLLALMLGASAVRRAAADESLTAPVPVPPAAPRPAPRLSAAALESAGENVVRRNPFRISRAPGIVRVGQPVASSAGESRPMVIAPVKPNLIVRAIVGGPPWSALLDGLPNGVAGVVVREGDVFGTLRIGAITPDTVAAMERDSVWKFTVNRNPQ